MDNLTEKKHKFVSQIKKHAFAKNCKINKKKNTEPL